MSTDTNGEPSKLAVAAGFGIGVLWIAIAAWCLLAGMRGFNNERGDFGLAWTVVGVLLLGCGIAAIVGTWWHEFRLKRRH